MLKSNIIGALLAGVATIGLAGCCHSHTHGGCDDCCCAAPLQSAPASEPALTVPPPGPSEEEAAPAEPPADYDASAPVEDAVSNGIRQSAAFLPSGTADEAECCGM